jgi:hypothetical protein
MEGGFSKITITAYPSDTKTTEPNDAAFALLKLFIELLP